jgi:RND family efflux transporter MFP subunit
VAFWTDEEPMGLSKRVIGFAAAGAVVLVAAAGVYLRIKGEGNTEEGGSGVATVPEGGAEQVSAAETFSTDIPIPVEGAQVTRDTLVISVSASAQAAPAREAKILAQVEGRITRLATHEDAPVSAGTVLIEIDTTEYALELARARAQLAKAEASYRELTLFDDQIEDQAVRTERARIARAKSGLEDAEIAVRAAELRLARTRITAPFAGRVASLKVVEGVTVRIGDELVTVADLNPIRLEAQVLEAEVALLARGRRATAAFAAFPGEQFTGTIQTINPVVERDTRTARVTVNLANPDGRILPGMYARVSLEARKFPDRILVPRAAILERDRRTMLFVYEGDGSSGAAKWRYVTTGLMNDSLVEIVANPETEMVQPGEWVLTDGHYSLTHDAHVRLVENVAAAGGRPQ